MGYFDHTRFDSIYDMVDAVNEVVRRNVLDNMEQVSADELGLDRRCGRVWVCEDFIAVEGGSQSLDYYGGFEYVDRDCVTVMGDYKFYSAEDDRVRDAIDVYYETAEAEEDA